VVSAPRDDLRDDVRELQLVVNGDGNGSPGLRIRMDRQERMMQLIVWFAGIITTAALVALVTQLVTKGMVK
jgi:hypothetical protein